MMTALLIYCYATGRRGSRTIEAATYTDVAVMAETAFRHLWGGRIRRIRAHPDYSVICGFRTRNRAAFKEAFVKVLMLAREVGKLKKAGGISVDGTKIHANASKHSAVSRKRAKETIAVLEGEMRKRSFRRNC
jgi:transposase